MPDQVRFFSQYSTSLPQLLQGLTGFLIQLFYGQTRSVLFWVPVLFGLGIGIYFSLPKEPPIWVGGILAAIALSCFSLAFTKRHDAITSNTICLFRLLFLSLGTLCAGLLIAQTRSLTIETPILASAINTQELLGYVEKEELTHRGFLRLTIRVQSISGLKPENTPHRVVLVSYDAKGPDNKEGYFVKLAAYLSPSYRPTHPGAYDPSRRDYFNNIGARGRVRGDVTYLEKQNNSFAVFIARARTQISRFILDNVSVRAGRDDNWEMGPFAVALLTGKRGFMDKEHIRVLRNAGLAHILAISGLHMMLFTGTLFWLARALMCLSPYLALRFPIKKYAAMFGLIGGFFYLVISGGPISAQRAFIMVSIMFLAVLVNRRAISLHNLALSAMVILILSPESLLSVSFQMSFASVAALIIFYEMYWRHFKIRFAGLGALNASMHFLLSIALTTVIASAATAPFVIYYFGELPLYGLFANVLVMPIFTLLTMPLGLLGVFSWPFGLSGILWELMGVTLELLTDIAEYFSTLSGATYILPHLNFISLLLCVGGGLWFILWQGKIKWFACLFVATAVVSMADPDKPDVMISESGRMFAVKQHNGSGMLSLSDKGSGYIAKRWLHFYGEKRTVKEARQDGRIKCDAVGCAYLYQDDHGQVHLISLVRDRSALNEECGQADILILSVPVRLLPANCTKPRHIITRLDLWKHGAHALTLKDDGMWGIKTASSQQGERPWNRDWVYRNKISQHR